MSRIGWTGTKGDDTKSVASEPGAYRLNDSPGDDTLIGGSGHKPQDAENIEMDAIRALSDDDGINGGAGSDTMAIVQLPARLATRAFPFFAHFRRKRFSRRAPRSPRESTPGCNSTGCG